MSLADRQTRTHLMRLFERHGFSPRADLGQNFLIDLNIIDFVVLEAEIGRNDVILEVGTGTGGLTTSLARDSAAVVSVEYDSRMYALAQEVLSFSPNVTLINADALKNKNHLNPQVMSVVEQKLAESPDRRLKLVANLPYNVATPVISNLVATDLPWERMVVTIQLELALRMTAQPKSSS
ncbi:MAG TPA: rRNA adenine N-6-methyltransferase family protein, partial [Planctomycetaceae bacterium]|nr:rRNA adenine N-6-methyltransferase family protein [Planctomycetaceae bacterium]